MDNTIHMGAIRALVKGMGRLMAGQQCFAEEFGYPLGRMFPGLYDNPEEKMGESQIEACLRCGKPGEQRIEQWVESMVKYQLMLIAALDEIALEGVLVSVRRDSGNRWTRRLHGLLEKIGWKKRDSHVRPLIDDPWLRFNTLVVPGVLSAMLGHHQSCEKR